MQSTVSRYEPRQDRSEETSYPSPLRPASAHGYELAEPEEVGAIILSEGKEAVSFWTSSWRNGANGHAEFSGASGNFTISPISLAVQVDRVPQQHLPQHRFLVLQKWEGTVSALKEQEKEFVAVIRDLTQTRSDEEATFPIEEIPDSDRDLLAPGAVFYWNVGYELNSYGQRKRVSAIRFRRLPAWTRSEIESVRRTAERFKGIFGLNAQPQSATRA